MLEVPAVKANTVPVVLMVATAMLLLLQVPPVVVSTKVPEAPIQYNALPVIADTEGVALIVTVLVAVAVQPEPTV
jgi:hypothetical protein